MDVTSTPHSMADALARISDLEGRLEAANREIGVLRLQLDLLATTDPMTGLVNERGVFERIEQVAAESAHTRSSFVVLSVDLPQLGSIAETHSRELYEEATKHLAALVGATARDFDAVGRMNDGGLLVVMPRAGEEVAMGLISELADVLEPAASDGVRPLTPLFAAVVFETSRPLAVPQVLQLVTEARQRAAAGEPMISRVDATETGIRQA